MNFSPSSAARGAFGALLVLVAGCGEDDGSTDLERGQAAYEVRDLAKAERFFEKSLARAPEDPDRLLLLARVRLDLGEIAAARELVTRAAAVAGKDSDVMLFGAQVAWHAKDYEAAAETFSAVADRADFDAATRAEGFAGLGIVEMTCNNRHRARIAFLRAIRLDRRCASAWYHLAQLYRDGFGYPEAALENFEIFVRLEASASPRVQRVQRSDIPGLKEAITRAAADRPGVAKRDSSACAAEISKAEAALKKRTYKPACQHYEAALKADPISYPAALGLAQTQLKVDPGKGGQAKAFESYKLACALRPSAISTFLTAGSMAAKLGYHAQAVEIYSRAVAASPASREALDGLIRALRKVGNKASVAQAYQEYRDSLTAPKRK